MTSGGGNVWLVRAAAGFTPVVLGWISFGATAADGMMQMWLVILGGPVTGVFGGLLMSSVPLDTLPEDRPGAARTISEALGACVGLAITAAAGAALIFPVMPGKWGC